MSNTTNRSSSGMARWPRLTRRGWAGIATAAIFVGLAGWFMAGPVAGSNAASSPLPDVGVSTPLKRNLNPRMSFLGQFSSLNLVELRAQVGGVLTEIHFKDGDIVHQGDLLFEIDPVPYQIKLNQADAQLESAAARLELANHELQRAKILKETDSGTQENVEQRVADQRTAQAAVDDAKAQIRDARFDLDHCRITAPFAGRIGNHRVSVGNLIAGSRAANSPTTLLATIVSLDPIYLNFDMSEADYQAFQRARSRENGPLADKVEIAIGDNSDFHRQGQLDFIDNAIDRSSGTIHARATVANPGGTLTAGEFARVRLATSGPIPTLLVPDVAVMADQSEHVVLTVGPDDTIVPKQVQIGDLRGTLRVIQSGLTATDKVVIDGLPFATPGAKVHDHRVAIHLADGQG